MKKKREKREERWDTMKKKREDERENERQNEEREIEVIFFSKKCFRTLKPARWISPKCFEKKSPSDELFLHFSFESAESGRFSINLHDSNSIFWAGRINSEGVSGRTVLAPGPVRQWDCGCPESCSERDYQARGSGPQLQGVTEPMERKPLSEGACASGEPWGGALLTG